MNCGQVLIHMTAPKYSLYISCVLFFAFKSNANSSIAIARSKFTGSVGWGTDLT
jgi:hypothetical protein